MIRQSTFLYWLTILKRWYWLVIVLVALHLSVFLVSVGGTWLSWRALRGGQLAVAAKTAQWTSLATQSLAWTWGWISPDVRMWHHSLELVATLPQLADISTNYLSGLNDTPSDTHLPTPLAQQLAMVDNQVGNIANDWSISLLAHHLGRAPREQIQHQFLIAQDWLSVAQYLLTGQRRLVILLQNSHELRATGGFAGSFLFVELQQGRPTTMEIRDIYQPDGQFTGYIEPPAGVKEFLSEGRSWRLPDANWSADFPTSATVIARFFSQSDYHDLDAVGTINLDLMEQLLAVVGPIELVDYDVVVTPENLAQVARADRDSFFPGSYQKPQFLQALFNQVKFRITQLNGDQLRQLYHLLRKGIRTKDLQWFFIDPNQQAAVERLHLSGSLDTSATDLCPVCTLSQTSPLFIGLIESNVGINKSNPYVERAVALDIHDQILKGEITFQNQATPSTDPEDIREQSYINYQRVLLPAGTQVTSIMNNTNRVENWQTNSIVTANGTSLTEIGWLTIVEPGAQTQVLFEVTIPTLSQLTPALILNKQSGIPATLYTINWDGQLFQGEISADTVLTREMLQSSRHDNLTNF